jgi:hypothetical protein
MTAIVEVLYEWQDLAGAVIGGVIALAAALIVAKDARARLERAAAMVVIAALGRVRANYEGALRPIRGKAKTDEEEAMGLATLFSLHPPTLPRNFAESASALMPIHNHLAAHLALADAVYENVSQAVHRWQDDQEHFSRAGDRKLPRDRGDMLADAKTIRRGMAQFSDHATCAEALLEHLVMSRYRLWHRLRLRCFPDKEEEWCARALKTGEFETPARANS